MYRSQIFQILPRTPIEPCHETVHMIFPGHHIVVDIVDVDAVDGEVWLLVFVDKSR